MLSKAVGTDTKIVNVLYQAQDIGHVTNFMEPSLSIRLLVDLMFTWRYPGKQAALVQIPFGTT